MKSYNDAVSCLNGRSRRKLGNNTYLERRDEHTIVVLLHNTDVVTYRDNGCVVLNSGGWRTSTTKDRINTYSPVGVTQKQRVWYVDGEKLFHDNLTIQADGSTDAKEETKTVAAQCSANKRRINTYVNKFVEALERGDVRAPSAGDCWHCLLTSDGKPLGELTKDTSHLLSHFKENYFVPSLLVRAINVFPVSVTANAVISSKWDNDGSNAWPWDIAEPQIKSSMLRYLYRQFTLAA